MPLWYIYVQYTRMYECTTEHTYIIIATRHAQICTQWQPNKLQQENILAPSADIWTATGHTRMLRCWLCSLAICLHLFPTSECCPAVQWHMKGTIAVRRGLTYLIKAYCIK